MCGILAVLGCQDVSQAKRTRLLELSRRLKHRGPDWSGIYQHGNCFITHQRLAIVDPSSGDQPLYGQDETIVVARCNWYHTVIYRLGSRFYVCKGAYNFLNLGSIWFASEMKALHDDCERFEIFPPGHIFSSKQGSIRRWSNPPWYSKEIPSTPYDPLKLRQAFEQL
ncbi:asparagine synthetase [glutamine-hydrolyzing]-like [Cryptomeria japonica]|uniref:asparagine synthetase [glutamine-hydrolyzing]-like n=1 Tax=Cryptomeria japonica TaxID=3369 RepID=UPI0027D9EB8A|nr:asparagine synthetase [glutamine-hydrolyzing]-like [Cryptomeria japonica]